MVYTHFRLCHNKTLGSTIVILFGSFVVAVFGFTKPSFDINFSAARFMSLTLKEGDLIPMEFTQITS
jgi:hypothetical protein